MKLGVRSYENLTSRAPLIYNIHLYRQQRQASSCQNNRSLPESPHCASFHIYVVILYAHRSTGIVQKEPKLARARQIPEWEEYDAEIARFARKLADDGIIHSGMATADTNVLANAGATSSDATESSKDDQPQADVEDPGVKEQPRDEL